MLSKEQLIKILDESIARTEGIDPEEAGWGDFVLSIAAGLIAIRLDAIPAEIVLSVITSSDTIERTIRLAEILNDTEGFESMKVVHRTEAPDGALPPDEKAEVDSTFRRLVGLDDRP